MSEAIPQSFRAGHEALRATAKRAMREPGSTGAAARKLAALLDGHFLREEKFVLPLLGLLPALARGEAPASVERAAQLLAHLRAEIAQMSAEHREISAAVHELAHAAETEGKPEYVSLAEELVVHAHLEEEVLYPAALVAGELLTRRRAP
jgi:iron-sulfur cluster repair protein YtfE (RIC family)